MNFAARNLCVKVIMGVPVPMSAPPVLIAAARSRAAVANGPGAQRAVDIPVTHTAGVKSMNLLLGGPADVAGDCRADRHADCLIASAGQVRVKGMQADAMDDEIRSREFLGQGLAFPLQFNPRGQIARPRADRDIEQAID